MAISVRENEKIKGVKINGVDHKISQFADDTTLVSYFVMNPFWSCLRILITRSR